jgi:hypothetical protein
MWGKVDNQKTVNFCNRWSLQGLSFSKIMSHGFGVSG